ncbi:MAG: hypothetical protein RBT63_06305 [Bdellovibrionales bacterium]|jgi:hypothetical protein|nr:hypothetical protein [Bdellovibrionales bacterium]
MKSSTLGFKFVLPLIAIAGLSMGNEGCEEKATDRVLKMDIELGTLKGRQMRLPNGETVDFPYVANALFYRQVLDHNHFIFGNPVPSSTGYIAAGGTFKTQSADQSSGEYNGLVSELDVSVLDRYGFLRKIRKDGNAVLAGRMSQRALVEGKSTANVVSKLPACLYDLPQALIGGEVISFEMTGGGGIGIGYNSGGDLSGNVGGRIGFERSRLEVGLRSDDPLSQEVIAIGDGVSHQTDVSFGIDFIPGIPIGLNFFFNTPITDVIRTALTKGLDQLVDRYKLMLSQNRDWNEVWESRVVYDPELVNGDTHVAFRGGTRAGVQIGDKFVISNLHYAWEGAACYTRLKYRIPLTVTPIAEAEVVTVGNNISVAIVTYLSESKIQPGAQVKVKALKQPVTEKVAAR